MVAQRWNARLKNQVIVDLNPFGSWSLFAVTFNIITYNGSLIEVQYLTVSFTKQLGAKAA